MTAPSSSRSPALALLMLFLAFLVLVVLLIGGLWVVYQKAGAPASLLSGSSEDEYRTDKIWATLHEKVPEVFPPSDLREDVKPAESTLLQIRPIGRLKAPAAFHWRAIPGASSYTVRITGPDDERILQQTVEQNSLPWPDALSSIKRGQPYLIRVITTNFLGPHKETSRFTLASPQRIQQFGAGLNMIDQLRAEEDDKWALGVRLAMTLGFFLDAKEALGSLPPDHEDHARLERALIVYGEEESWPSE